MENANVVSFDSFDSFATAETGTMTVVVNGAVTGWTWTFAGPGHQKAIDQSNRLSRQRLHDEAQKEQARVNGRKWKAPEETPEQKREENITYIVERLLGWSAVKVGGEDFIFSEENARKLLSDPKRSQLLVQALEFIFADDSFTPRSAST